MIYIYILYILRGGRVLLKMSIFQNVFTFSIYLKSKGKAETILRFQGVWVNSEAKAGYARHRAKEISTRLIRTWWYLRRLPGCNRDHVHTRCNRVCPAPLRFLRANRPWHSPIPWVEQLQLVQPRFTNDIFAPLPFETIATQPFPTLSHPVNRSRTRLHSVIVRSIATILYVYLYTRSWTELSGKI